MNYSRYPAWSILLGGVCLAWGEILSPFAAEVTFPLKHGQWEALPELTDEFDGNRLDESKWFPNNPGWLGRQPYCSALQIPPVILQERFDPVCSSAVTSLKKHSST